MISSKTILATILGIALIASPATVSAEPNEEMIKALNKLERLTKELEKTESNLRDTNAALIAAVSLAQNDIENLKLRVKALEAENKLLRAQLAPPASTSNRIDTSAAIQTTGRIKVSNDFATTMSVVVNGLEIPLASGESRFVSVPAGTFTYYIPQMFMRIQTRSIAPDETKSIRIYNVIP